MHLTAFLTSCVLLLSTVYAKSGFLFTAPKVLQSGAQEKVCLKLHEVTQDVNLEIKITAGETEDNYSFTFKDGKSRCVHLNLPAISHHRAKISLKGNTADESYVFNDTRTVSIQQNTFLTFIQTDKPIYKPGQTVKFRILSTTPDLKPLLSNVEKVWLEDSVGSRIAQWLDVPNQQGLSSLQMKLSEEPVQGVWKISAVIEGRTEEQTFEVKEYVLPKFSVTIKPPSHLPIDADTIDFEVCAKYTYGEPVSGDLVIALCVAQHNSYWYGNKKETRPCSLMLEKIKGCKKFSVPSEEIGLRNTNYHLAYSAKLKITATVTEATAGLRQNATDESCPFVHERLQIDLSTNSPKGFKPGLNFYGKAIVTTPGGEPAPRQIIEIKVDNYKSGEVFQQYYETDKNGEFVYSVPSFKQILDNSYSIRFMVDCPVLKDPTPNNKKSCVIYQLSHMEDPSHIYLGETKRARAVEYNYTYTEDDPYYLRMYMPTGNHHVKQWFSPSGSFLQVNPLHRTLLCDEEVEITVAYTTEANTDFKFNYEVMSRGNIVHSGHKHHRFIHHDYRQPSSPDTVSQENEKDPRQPAVEETIVPHTASVLGRHRRDVIFPYFFIEDTNANITLPPHVSSVKLRFRVTSDMAPLSRLVVYYTRPDGEVVADSTELTVEKCLANKVDMSLGEQTAHPGGDTTFRLKASPDSLCAVGVVDKSVHILRSSNQLTIARIFEQLKQYNIGSRWSNDYNDYCDKQLAKLPKPTLPPIEPERPGPVPFTPNRPRLVPVDNRPEGVSEEPEDDNVSAEIGNGEGEDDSDGGESVQDAGEDESPMRLKRSIWFPDQSNYYDSLQAFEEEGQVVMTDLTLQTRPCRRFTIMPYARGQPGVEQPEPMAVAVEDADVVDSVANTASPKASSVNLRSYFPETWLWDLEVVGASGELAVPKKVPDTITEWVGSAFCTNPTVGLGVAPITTLKAFKPFFASFNLPYSVIRGEKVPVLISVFNYLDECLAINLRLKRSPDGGYHRLNKVNSVDLCVCGQETMTHKFRIIPMKLGNVNITVAARTAANQTVCGRRPMSILTGLTDAVIRPMLVEPEGLPQEYTFSSFFCPEKDGEDTSDFKEIDLPLPSNVVNGSARGSVTVIGDIMGPALSNLDNLLRMPYGCGEQNMVGFAPNIFVLQYLQNTGLSSEIIEGKAKEYMRSGYQRELTYKHPDGSYSAFGMSDDSGSMWLTAFVVKCFAQAKPFIFIDEVVLNKSISWFIGHQLENGCFPSVGRVLSKYMQGGISGGSQSALTAYVLVAMLEAGLPASSETVTSAISCLDIQPMPTLDSYTAALVSYAYTLYNPEHPKRLEYMALLQELAISKDGLMHWHNPDSRRKASGSDWFRPYGQTNAASVEMSAYALLAMIAEGGDDVLVKGLPVVRWLSRQRNGYGGFASTQDTVIALQALARYAALAYKDGIDLAVLLDIPNQPETELTVTASNSLVLQSVSVDNLPAVVAYKVTGSGCALLQANVKYNMDVPRKPAAAFLLKVATKRAPQCNLRLLNICTSYRGEDGASNMAVVEVKMISGWIPVKSSLKRLMKNRALRLKRYDVDPKFVHFYFDEISGVATCFQFEIEQTIEVEQPKPSTIRVYDYYERDQFAVTTYSLRKICGTKLEIPFYTGPDLEDAINEGLQVRVIEPLMPPTEANNTEPQVVPLSRSDSVEPIGNLRVVPPTVLYEASCPLCFASVREEDLLTAVCSATHVYKLRKRPSSVYPLKVMADLRPQTKMWLGKFASFSSELPCSCDLLSAAESGKKFVAITTSDDPLTPKPDTGNTVHMTLDAKTQIVSLGSNTERLIRQHIKRGNCK